MKNKKFITISLIAALALGLGFSASVFAAQRGGDKAEMKSKQGRAAMMAKRGKGDMGLRILAHSDKLDLTEEQEAQILELSQEHRAKIDAHRDKMKPLREEGKALREADGFDEAAVRAHMEKAMPLMIEGRILQGNYKNAISEVLTDDQKAKIKKAHEGMRQRIVKRFQNVKERRGNWGQGRSPLANP